MSKPYILWHGAKRWDGPPQLRPAGKMKSEHGSGLYLTTSEDTARKYSKGGGVVMRFEVDSDLTWLDRTRIHPDDAIDFIHSRPRLKNRKKIEDDLQMVSDRALTHRGSPLIMAGTLSNLMYNWGALTGAHGPALAQFYVDQGIDADLVTQSGEDWVILFNLDKILNYRRAKPEEVVDMPLLRKQRNPIDRYTPTDQEVLEAVAATHTRSRGGAHPQGIEDYLRETYGHRALTIRAVKESLKRLRQQGEIFSTGNGCKLKKKPKRKGVAFVKEDSETYSVFVDGVDVGMLIREQSAEWVGASREASREYSWYWEESVPEDFPLQLPGQSRTFRYLNELKLWVKAKVKKAQQRTSNPEEEYDLNNPDDIEYLWDEFLGGGEELEQNTEDYTQDPFQRLLVHFDIDPVKVDFLNGPVWIIEWGGKKYIVSGPVDKDDPTPFSATDAESWLGNAVGWGDPTDYVKVDELEDFWDDPSPLYHATEEENVDDIIIEGLEPRSETRGMTNRWVGASVFASLSPDNLDSYGDFIFEINTMAMKRDGRTPMVMLEPDVVQYDAATALLRKLDMEEDYPVDAEQGMDLDTVIVGGAIPAKYLKEYEG